LAADSADEDGADEIGDSAAEGEPPPDPNLGRGKSASFQKSEPQM